MSLVGRAPIVVGCAAVLLACAPVLLSGPDCRPVATNLPLPGSLHESSGAAFAATGGPGALWTHNDGHSRLFAVDSTGRVLGSWTVAPRLRDWEDMARGACEIHQSCLYLADTGDNGERRPDGNIRIVRVAEPSLPDETGADSGARSGGEVRGEVFPVALPDGPRDIEAMFVLPGERLYLVTKGRNHPVTVYGYPLPLRPDTVTLKRVQELSPEPRTLGDQVTGASASADGRVVVIRTYQELRFYEVEGDTLGLMEDGGVNLRPLREAQGEAVALGAEGRVALTSEAGLFGSSPGMNLLRCELAGGRRVRS